MDFLRDLQEARMTRNSNNQKTLTYNDCKERAYLILLMLQVMRFYKHHKNRAAAYAQKTVMYRDYTRFRIDGTDLYNLFYFITGDESALKKLKDPEAAEKERARTLISVGKLNGLLRKIANSETTTNVDFENLVTLETELSITNRDYKEIRRRIAVFQTSTHQERQTVVTRLLFAARAKLSDSDFLADFSRLSLDKNLEDFDAISPEIDVSVPDAIDVNDVMMYRYFVPVSKLPFVAKFISNAKSGKTVISNFVQAYLPVIMMIDDIIQAGPAYIEQLKQLHRRAKRDLNR